jgi:ribonuclease T1
MGSLGTAARRSYSTASSRRPLRALLRCFVIVLVAIAAVSTATAADGADLRRFALEMRLRDVAGFVATIDELRATQRLPARYITKEAAERLGWRPGQDLCRVAPGRVIGGDRFLNAERRLPAKEGRRYREADLDPVCGRRGPQRLVFSDDGLQFVTVDHYRTFVRVPD